MAYLPDFPRPENDVSYATKKRRERDANRTRLTVDLVKMLLISVRPSLREALNGIRTVPALQKRIADFIQITPQPLDRPALDTNKNYAVVLIGIGQNIIGAIKQVREERSMMGLREAKVLVDNVRDGLEQTLYACADYESCMALFDRFNAIGCKLAFVEVA